MGLCRLRCSPVFPNLNTIWRREPGPADLFDRGLDLEAEPSQKRARLARKTRFVGPYKCVATRKRNRWRPLGPTTAGGFGPPRRARCGVSRKDRREDADGRDLRTEEVVV